MKFLLWPLLYISLFLPLRLTLYSSTFLPSRLCHFLPYFTSLHPYIFLFLPFPTLPSPFLFRFFFFLSILHRHHTPSIIFSHISSFFFRFCSPLLSCNVLFSLAARMEKTLWEGKTSWAIVPVREGVGAKAGAEVKRILARRKIKKKKENKFYGNPNIGRNLVISNLDSSWVSRIPTTLLPVLDFKRNNVRRGNDVPPECKIFFLI